jgi:hypothetical protein
LKGYARFEQAFPLVRRSRKKPVCEAAAKGWRMPAAVHDEVLDDSISLQQ